MSSAHSDQPQAPSNEDDVDMRKIVSVGAVSMVIFAISAVAAYLILNGDRAKLRAGGEAKPGKLIGQAEIGIVDQVPFDIDDRLEIWRADKARRLAGYGWVDRRQGIVHVPIEQAMDEVIKKSAGGTQ